MSLSNLTRRAFLASMAAGAATFLMPRTAAAKPLEELTAATFSRQVYHNPKPVVVLFYEAGDGVALPGESTIEPSRRMNQVLEDLADKYHGQIAFFKVAIDHNPSNRKGDYERKFGVPDYSPLTVMYGRFDVKTGKQSPHNFKIDVKKGGPIDDTWITPFFENGNYWIKQNLFDKSPDGDRKLYRYEGTVELHEVGVMR